MVSVSWEVFHKKVQSKHFLSSLEVVNINNANEINKNVLPGFIHSCPRVASDFYIASSY